MASAVKSTWNWKQAQEIIALRSKLDSFLVKARHCLEKHCVRLLDCSKASVVTQYKTKNYAEVHIFVKLIFPQEDAIIL
jgi:hypothetical protein